MPNNDIPGRASDGGPEIERGKPEPLDDGQEDAEVEMKTCSFCTRQSPAWGPRCLFCGEVALARLKKNLANCAALQVETIEMVPGMTWIGRYP